MSTLLTDEQIESILEQDEYLERAYFVFKIKHNGEDALQRFFTEEILPKEDECILALMSHTGDDYQTCCDSIDDESWLVFTEEEADERASDYAESYADEIVSEIPKHLQRYFDADLFVKDMLEDSDRGGLLSSYDGNEYEVKINDTYYYLYKN